MKKVWSCIKVLWTFSFVIAAIVSIIIITLTPTIRGCHKIPDQEQTIIQEKDQKIKELNNQITELENQNIEATKKYLEVKNKINILEKQKQSIKKPEGASAIKDRFRNLGYNPK